MPQKFQDSIWHHFGSPDIGSPVEKPFDSQGHRVGRRRFSAPPLFPSEVHSDLGVHDGSFTAKGVPSHDSRMFMISVPSEAGGEAVKRAPKNVVTDLDGDRHETRDRRAEGPVDASEAFFHGPSSLSMGSK